MMALMREYVAYREGCADDRYIDTFELNKINASYL